MGPPLKAAENPRRPDGQVPGRGASMGPPLKAAENDPQVKLGAESVALLQWGRR